MLLVLPRIFFRQHLRCGFHQTLDQAQPHTQAKSDGKGFKGDICEHVGQVRPACENGGPGHGIRVGPPNSRAHSR